MFSPIFIWELRSTLRRRSFLAVRFGYAFFVLLIFFVQIADLENVINTARSHRSVDHFLRNTLEYRHFLLVVHFFAILLMTPILTATSITRERDLRTLELLLTTQQQSTDIVLGKWLAALAKLCLLTMPIVPPLLWIEAMLGGDWWTILIWLDCSWLLAAVGAAWSVLASTLIRHTAAAWLASYLGTGMLGASMPLFFSDLQRCTIGALVPRNLWRGILVDIHRFRDRTDRALPVLGGWPVARIHCRATCPNIEKFAVSSHRRR